MKPIFSIPAFLFSCSLFLCSPEAFSAADQGKGKDKHKGNKHYSYSTAAPEREYQGKKDKSQKAFKHKNKGKGNAHKFPNSQPRSFKVPPGHYPPAGTYRIWYPGRPPGHQPAPVAYGYPPNAPITDGAFIIHGNQAYDTQYDWRKAEAKKPKSVPREIIDILFPGNTIPAQ